MNLKIYRQILVVITTIVVTNFYSCKRSENNKILNEKSSFKNPLCKRIKTKGVENIFCEEWIDKESSKVFSVSKTKNKLKEEFFVEIFTSKDLHMPVVTVYDFIKDCPVDYSINFFTKSFSISDLDNDGVKEITFLYELACQGGIGPTKMKLMMIEGVKKYVIRGFRLDEVSIKNNITPNYYPNSIVDKAFINAPKMFLTYAKKKWINNYGTKIKSTNNSVIIKKVSFLNSKIHIELSNNKKLTFKAVYFLEDEKPIMSVKNNRIISTYGDDYGNFIEAKWLFNPNDKNLYLVDVKGSFPLKNKTENNLKNCVLHNLSKNINTINTDEVFDLLLNSSNCTYKSM